MIKLEGLRICDHNAPAIFVCVSSYALTFQTENGTFNATAILNTKVPSAKIVIIVVVLVISPPMPTPGAISGYPR